MKTKNAKGSDANTWSLVDFSGCNKIEYVKVSKKK